MRCLSVVTWCLYDSGSAGTARSLHCGPSQGEAERSGETSSALIGRERRGAGVPPLGGLDQVREGTTTRDVQRNGGDDRGAINRRPQLAGLQAS